MNQITINEAFNKYKKIEMEYIRVAKCSSCGTLTDVYEPEKNFSGTLKDFETYSKKFPDVNLGTLVEEDPLEPGLVFLRNWIWIQKIQKFFAMNATKTIFSFF